MFSTKLPLRDHHLAVAVPIAATVVVIAFQALWPRVKWVGLAVGILYAGSALAIDLSAARMIRQTGGIGMWSKGIQSVADDIERNHIGERVQILDWGFKDNLYVLSAGRISSEELFWGASKERLARGKSWEEYISAGGVFLLPTSLTKHFPESATGFREALRKTGMATTTKTFFQTDGRAMAELMVLAPAAGKRGTPIQAQQGSPVLLELYPPYAVAGQGFNVQPDGQSALAVTCKDIHPPAEIVLGDRAMPTVSGKDTCVITTTIPKTFLEKPGAYPIFIRDRAGESNRRQFVVRATP
jgi:hypothetical protein